MLGAANTNPMLDTRTYAIECHTNEYTVNAIAQNMYAQCDEESNQFNLMDDIVDHRADDNAFDRADMYITPGSNRQVRKNTIGW
jgi:hypothetical protein